MQKWGKTSTGKQRYKCKICRATKIHSRKDNTQRANYGLFVNWLTSSQHLADIAQKNYITVQGLLLRFESFWKKIPTPKSIADNPKIIIVDGVSVVKRKLMVLIAHNPITRKPINWYFTQRESYDSWYAFFAKTKKQGINPAFIVCDGQRGLLKTIRSLLPDTKIQRCVFHIIRQSKVWLTQSPKTQAGKKLLIIVKSLSQVHTKRQKRRWLRCFRKWMKRYEKFLKEKTYHQKNSKKYWYTHKRLRAVRSLIKNSINDLFTYVSYSEIPRTTNHVEGGINSRLKDLLRVHRGLLSVHQQVMVAWFLASKQGQKPTRNFN